MQNLAWYLNRLRCMSAAEIVYRARCLGIALWETRRPPTHLALACGDPRGTDRGPSGRYPAFFLESEDPREAPFREALLKAIPDIVTGAERLCAHRFSALGMEDVHLGERINWHLDPVHEVEAPRVPAHRLDYRDVRLAGEAKNTWEINRHQHLPVLALACVLTGEERYAREATGQLQDWIRENPYRIGINWTSALECALRLVSWSWTWFLLEAEGQWRPPEGFFPSVGEHCGFIQRSFSRYSSRGNHLVGEAAGLFTGALVFAHEPYRSQWCQEAHRILAEEIEEQVHPDGACKELSTGYHRFVTELFLLPALLGRRNGIEFPTPYWARLEKMLGYLHAMRDTGGWQPDLGDNDTGRGFPLAGLAEREQPDSLLATGAILFDRPEWLRGIDHPDAETLLLLGKRATEMFLTLKQTGTRPEPSPSQAFPDAGYYILRESGTGQGELFLVFDCGPMGLEPMAGHGHADTLSIVLSLGGVPIFVDPGTYTYRTGNPWRSYFRETGAHNTIRIDRESISLPGGSFLWTRKARGRLRAWEPGSANPRVQASHDGYTRLKDPVVHVREVRVDRDGQRVLLRDEIRARASHRVEIFFHLAPECSVRLEEGLIRIERDEKRVGLKLDPRMDIRIAEGETHPILGWYSPRYGVRKPTRTIVGQHDVEGSAEYTTEILLLAQKACRDTTS